MFEDKKNKILIIEDDALLARVLAEGFDCFDCVTFNVYDGLVVLDSAKKIKPDIILLDLILYEVDGFEVLKQLKENDETVDIPVVVISNLDSAIDVDSAIELGAEEYFIKAHARLEQIVEYVKERLNSFGISASS